MRLGRMAMAVVAVLGAYAVARQGWTAARPIAFLLAAQAALAAGGRCRGAQIAGAALFVVLAVAAAQVVVEFPLTGAAAGDFALQPAAFLLGATVLLTLLPRRTGRGVEGPADALTRVCAVVATALALLLLGGYAVLTPHYLLSAQMLTTGLVNLLSAAAACVVFRTSRSESGDAPLHTGMVALCSFAPLVFLTLEGWL